MAREETNILNRIRLKISNVCRTFRNNVGLFSTDTGVKVRTGLCKGSSDLIGWTPIQVTRAMVGSKVCIFTGIEIKSSRGRLSKDQTNFISQVNSSGGIAFMARSPEEAEVKLNTRVKEIQDGIT